MDCAYYLCPRGTSVDAHLFIGVGDEEYHINLNKGTYNLSFYALGWDGKSATNLYFYPAPTEDKKPSEVATDDKTLVGTFTPTNHIPNGDGKKTNYVISTADAMNYVINIPADGTYIIEFEMPKAANWNGTLYSDIHITNVGALSDGPVNKINTAIASAAKMLASADAAKYRGADYDKLTDVKATADGFIAAQKATMVNLPSVYETEGKEVDAAVSALKLHMDTVDAFDKAFADVEAKLAVYADSLKAFEGLAVVTALKETKTAMSDYAYAEKAPGVIAADTKKMNDGIKAVDDRQAINDQFTTAIADAQKSLADPKASKFVAEYANLDEAIADAQAFDAVSATDDELKGQMASLNEIKLALDVKLLAADVVSIRIKALDKLAKSVGANYGDATAEIQGRIDNIDSDDDGLANVMKAAIKAALYSKIANGDSIGVVDLTPFIKNYHLYATITGPVVDNSSKELPNSRNDAECKGENNPGSQIMKIGHQWGQDALGKKIWVLLYGTDYDNVFPGWTVKSFITGRGHSMVTPDNKDYSNLSKGIPVFDGALTLDWNSQAQLSTSLDDLPVGVYNLSVPFGSLDAATDAATTFKATTTADEYVAKFEADGAKSATLDSIKVNDGKMDIFLELQSKDGSSSADNFALKFLAKDESFNYALAAQSAVNEMNALITVVGDVEAVDAKIEYFTLGGIQVTVLEKGQAYIQKTTIGDEIITKTVFVE